MASPHTNDFDFPHFPPPPSHPFLPPPPSAAKPPSPSRFRPPPPFHPVTPPPPHVRPPPPPTPDNHPTVIVIVFISVGGIFFFAFLAAAIFCFINKKKKKKTVQETEIIHVDEHRNVHEAIIPCSHGSHAVILSIDDDIHIDEKIGKKEELGEDCMASLPGVNLGSSRREDLLLALISTTSIQGRMLHRHPKDFMVMSEYDSTK